MFSLKKNYFFIIESTKDINLKNIKKRDKFTIIYRNQNNLPDKSELIKFRKECKVRSIDFYVANNVNLAINLNSDGIYLSAHNKSLRTLSLKKTNFHIIGSAHSFREIFMKVKQGCKTILLSKLFLVNYNRYSPFLGVIRFNNYLLKNKNLIPLGGINLNNLNKLNNIDSKGFALMSEIKKKPANIINRLF